MVVSYMYHFAARRDEPWSVVTLVSQPIAYVFTPCARVCTPVIPDHMKLLGTRDEQPRGQVSVQWPLNRLGAMVPNALGVALLECLSDPSWRQPVSWLANSATSTSTQARAPKSCTILVLCIQGRGENLF